jgi:hypothetical protein
MTEQLNDRKLSPEVKKFVSEGVTGFEGVYVIHADEDWVYDSRKTNHNARLYKLNSDEGTKLKKEINQAISDFVQQHMKEIRELKKEKPAASETVATPSKEDAEASLRDIGKQMKDAMTTSGNIEEIEALLELGQVAIDQARTAGVGEGIIKNIEGIRKGLQVKYNNYKRAEEKRVGGSEAQQQSKMFVGKDITELNAKNGGLAALLVENSNVGFVKKVYAALQAAEEAGIPIDQAKVSAGITAILEADRAEKKQLLNDLINEINGCNK